MHQREVWIVAAKRTPMGRFQGELSSFTAPQLGSAAIKAVLNDVTLDRSSVDELLMGCVLPAGCGQAPARQAALGAGIAESVPCTTINKVCGSGMKTVMLAHSMIQFGEANCVIAGGMESMTNAPYLLPNARQGMRIGHKSAYDHMFTDGLEDAYEGKLMGMYGQAVADELGFSREQMDSWATMSAERALNAQQQGLFSNEIAPLDSQHREPINEDELPKTINLDKIPKLKPAFSQHGTITAANSSAISDGAAALLLMEKEQAIALQLKPLAIIKGHASFARKPSEFTLAPVGAIKQLLTRLEWRVDDVDGWEINEAFAVVTQIAVNHFKLDSDNVNVNGGACALGHPLGASGARILVTLIHSLKAKLASSECEKSSLKGVAALCIGGGEATAIAVEIPR
ncbi:thiolase family protein [Vibrio mediterranei]|uniref:thiolase family protein n=1 Tax=Vibrio mediterranei TaxID=689 RepID=UPI001EFD3ED2|nr:thiolase family protein [Vibrio mediterranei]MCG9662521.1 thiolase family protein [Vibrio mediterranei]